MGERFRARAGTVASFAGTWLQRQTKKVETPLFQPYLLADEARFELAEGFALTRFRGVLLRPLGHSSICCLHASNLSIVPQHRGLSNSIGGSCVWARSSACRQSNRASSKAGYPQYSASSARSAMRAASVPSDALRDALDDVPSPVALELAATALISLRAQFISMTAPVGALSPVAPSTMVSGLASSVAASYTLSRWSSSLPARRSGVAKSSYDGR